jgi:hypothetical protein
MKLTIAIPTFDRNAVLASNLAKLLPQLTPDCHLLIIDNQSSEPVSDTICQLLRQYPTASVKVVRNPHNVGCVANIIRCYELCETEWLWVLGDDDEPKPDAIQTILTEIEANPRTIFINFATEIYRREREVRTRGLAEFVNSLDSFGNVLLISAGVVRAPKLQPNLKFAYHYAYSLMAHLVLLMASIQDGDECVLSHKQIVSWEPPPPDQHWSAVNESLGKTAALDMPLPHDVRLALSRQIGLPRMEDLLLQFLLTIDAGGDPREARFLYEQVTSRFVVARPSLSLRLKRWGYRQALRAPRLSLRMADFALRRIKRRTAKDIGLRDRLRRL